MRASFSKRNRQTPIKKPPAESVNTVASTMTWALSHPFYSFLGPLATYRAFAGADVDDESTKDLASTILKIQVTLNSYALLAIMTSQSEMPLDEAGKSFRQDPGWCQLVDMLIFK